MPKSIFISVQISDLKLALERKEAELNQIKGGTRNTIDSQKSRAVSPFRIPRGISNSSKNETSFRLLDDTKISEVIFIYTLSFHLNLYLIACFPSSNSTIRLGRLDNEIVKTSTPFYCIQARSCSSGKQRRSRFPSAFTEKEVIPKIPFLAEERLVISGKQRSPSPPVRRSISTDRGALIRPRVKADTTENQPIAKPTFPARVPVNKSLASTMPSIPSTDNNSRIFISSQESTKHDDISDALYSFQKAKKVYLENEDEQFKQALNVRQGGIRKSKNETKAKAKQNRIPKYDAVTALSSDLHGRESTEEARKSDLLEPENEHIPVTSSIHNYLMAKKLRQNSSRNYINLEPRYD